MIKPGQKIHASVCFIPDYVPQANFSPGQAGPSWENIVGKGRRSDSSWVKGIEDLLELDLFDYLNVKSIIEGISQAHRQSDDIERLRFIALTRRFTSSCCDSLPLLTSVIF